MFLCPWLQVLLLLLHFGGGGSAGGFHSGTQRPQIGLLSTPVDRADVEVASLPLATSDKRRLIPSPVSYDQEALNVSWSQSGPRGHKHLARRQTNPSDPTNGFISPAVALSLPSAHHHARRSEPSGAGEAPAASAAAAGATPAAAPPTPDLMAKRQRGRPKIEPAAAATAKERLRIIVQHTAAKRARAAFPAGTPERAMYERLLHGKTQYSEAVTALRRIAQAEEAAAAARARLLQPDPSPPDPPPSPALDPSAPPADNIHDNNNNNKPFGGRAMGPPPPPVDRGPPGTKSRWGRKPPKPLPRRRRKKHAATWRPADEDVLLQRGEVEAAKAAWQRKRRRGALAVRLLYVAGEEAARRLRALPLPPPTTNAADGSSDASPTSSNSGGGSKTGGEGGAGSLAEPNAEWHELLRLWPLIEQDWDALGEHDDALEELVGPDHGLPRQRARSSAAAADAAAVDGLTGSGGREMADEEGGADGWATVENAKRGQRKKKARGDTMFAQAVASSASGGADVLRTARAAAIEAGETARRRWHAVEAAARAAAPRLLRDVDVGGKWSASAPPVGYFPGFRSFGAFRPH